MDLVPGAVIAGRYRADKRVGAGGMGEVWAGEHLTIGVKVAIKTLLPAASLNHEVIARFKREAYFLGRVRSDHVARVLDFVTDDAYGLVLVMEFVAGESLGSILQKRRLTVEETIDLGVDVVSALADLHRAKIIHRDLKPGNIILQPLAEGRQRAVVVDFGVSRLVSGGDEEEETITGITKADMALGTLEYMAPEQILNSRDVTPASDLYAVGAMMFRALAGRHVYGNATDSELAHKKLLEDAPALETGRADRIAYALEAVVNRALKRKPAQRYKTADEMLSELVPIRDAARVAAIDLDSTTTTDQSLLVDGAGRAAAAAAATAKAPDKTPATEPGAVPAQTAAPARPGAAEPSGGAPAASEGRAAEVTPPPRDAVSTSGPSRNLSTSIPTPPPAKRGVAPGVLAAAALAALSLGAVAGSLLAERRYVRAMADAAEACEARVAAASASAAPAPAAPPPSAAAAAAAPAEPTASATAVVAAAPAAPEAKEIDLGELEPAASPAKAPPRPRPTAVASAAVAVAGASDTEKPAATASPAAAPSPSTTARAGSSAAASPEPAVPSKPTSPAGEPKPPSKIIDPFE